MNLYHRTTSTAATAILRDAFRDATGTYLTAREHTGERAEPGIRSAGVPNGPGAVAESWRSAETANDGVRP